MLEIGVLQSLPIFKCLQLIQIEQKQNNNNNKTPHRPKKAGVSSKHGLQDRLPVGDSPLVKPPLKHGALYLLVTSPPNTPPGGVNQARLRSNLSAEQLKIATLTTSYPAVLREKLCPAS